MIDAFLFQHANLIGNNELLWFTARRLPMVFELNRNSNVVRVLFETVNHKTFDSIAVNNNQLYLVSSDRREIIVYDYNTGKQIIKSINVTDFDNWAGSYVERDGQFVYGWQNPIIVTYSPNDDKWNVVDEWSADLRRKNTFLLRAIKAPQLIGEKYYAVIGNSKLILEFDLNTKASRLIELPMDNIESIICFKIIDGSSFFICQKERSNTVVLYKADSENFDNPQKMLEWDINYCDEFSFSEVVHAGKLLYLIPDEYDKAFVISLNDYEVREDKRIPTVNYNILSNNPGYKSNYFSGTYIDGYFLTINVWTMKLVRINCTTGELFVDKITKDISIENYALDAFGSNRIMMETPEFDAADYLRVL